MGVNRRTILARAGIAATAALAGCTQEFADLSQSDPGEPSDPTRTENTETSTATETDTPTDTPEPVPETYKVDFKDPSGNNLGSYTTPETWDDHEFSREEFEKQRDSWIDDIAYNQLIEKLENNEKVITPYGLYPNWEESGHDRGHWDKKAFKNEDQFAEIIDWVNNPVMMWQREGRGKAIAGPPSSENSHFAATMEKSVNQIHPDAEIRTAHVNQPGGHGTYLAYSPLDNIQGESHWMYINTTSETIAWAGGDDKNAGIPEEYYNPFVEGYPADQDQFDYNEIKTAGFKGLRTLAAIGVNPEGYHGKLSINDEFMESFYNDVVPNDKKGEETFETMARAAELEVEEDEYVTVYGDVENAQIAVGDEDLHKAVMNYSQSRSTEEIERYLDTGSF